jgi:hypothetical protein
VFAWNGNVTSIESSNYLCYSMRDLHSSDVHMFGNRIRIFVLNLHDWSLLTVHASCVEYSPELTKRIHDFEAADGARKILWECIDCKTCLKCNDSLLTKHHSVPEEPEVLSPILVKRYSSLSVEFHNILALLYTGD